MTAKTIVRRFLCRPSPKDDTMRYCYAHGFTSGENFHNYSDYPIDANWPWLISVGNNVTLSSGVKLLAHDASTAKAGAHTKIGIVRIGSNVFIGMNSIVLCNTRIGDNVVVGAGSVVTHDIPSNSVYAGNPAKFICTFEEFAAKHRANRQSHPTFGEHTWQEWPNASPAERAAMREKLEHTYGYL